MCDESPRAGLGAGRLGGGSGWRRGGLGLGALPQEMPVLNFLLLRGSSPVLRRPAAMSRFALDRAAATAAPPTWAG